MNILPTMEEQATQHLISEPSPFSHYNEETKQFLSDQDPFWKEAVAKKFDWVHNQLKITAKNHTPISLAIHSDEMHIHETINLYQNDSLLSKHVALRD